MIAPRVALLVETSREYGRGILRGVIRFHEERGPWSLYFKPQGLSAPPPSWLSSWRGDGILARINDRRMARAVLRARVPAVDLRGAIAGLGLPMVGMSNLAVMRLAVEHFLERGFRHFAFCGTPRHENRYQDERCELFQHLLAQRGFQCRVYPASRRLAAAWDLEQRDIARWLKSLPKPVAVMTCHDDRGQQVLDACLRAQLAVPDEAAILGVDNDPFLCNLSSTPLSSIDVNPERIGYEAAALLDRMMKGRCLARRNLYFQPRGVVARQSTDVTAVQDPHVTAVVQLIRDHACDPVSVEQLLKQVPVSRSALFRRFKRYFGRSPKEEMTRLRLERARELLRNTRLSVAAIAERTSYGEAKYFIEVFHRAVGMTPLRYRKQFASAHTENV
ncbi:MAG: XylR family transcriptional regulator [Verrucomicrobiia bacterium]